MEGTKKRPLMDTLVDSNELQILKAAIPYMHTSQQKQCALAVRIIELMKTTALFEQGNQLYAQELQACSVTSEQDRIIQMLTVIKDYCSESEKEQLDLLLNFFEMSELL